MLTDEELFTRREWFEDHWRSHIPFCQLIGLEITHWSPGLVRGRLGYADRLSAHDGVFHGGVLSTALDTIGTGAVVSGQDFNLGSRATTVAMSVQFMAVAPSEDVVIEGECLKRGRRLNFARATVRAASDGRLLAEASLTVSVSGERPRVDTPQPERSL